MSEEMYPDVEQASDVAVAEVADKTLAELVHMFEELMGNEERMKMSKEAEALKAAFYKRLQKEKADAGLSEVSDSESEEVSENPFNEIEKGFKAIYNAYRNERAEYNRQLEKEREQNLAGKEAVIADLKALLEKQEDLNATFPEFREIQNRWREIGPVPVQSYRNINDTYQLYVLEKEDQLWTQIKKNAPLILLLLVINLCLPYALMTQIERSITVRIKKLEEVFDSVDSEHLQKIGNVQGEDEIALLMRNYNRMADRTNELIQTVYKDKLKEQEMSIAKKNAELLALYGQINPHFMFNALESIRMHSILKQEYETADMVEKLAIMERQNVDWGEDNIEISKEMEFVKAYLGLQKYRFGDRLSYSLEVEDGCETLLIPKLTIVTFVENACVHGIESKTASGWIFVRIHKEGHEICIEVEDTGKGMPPEVMADIRDRMENADMSRLMKKGRVGILNACLRLKMVTDEEVKFSVESEEMVGTIIQIRIPIVKLMQLEK